MIDVRPSLYRVGTTVLVIALVSNVFLLWVSAVDDWFANIIAIASAVAAAVLVGAAMTAGERLGALRANALLVAFAVWAANLIEFASEEGPALENKLRQCGFYLAFGVLALGEYVLEERRR